MDTTNSPTATFVIDRTPKDIQTFSESLGKNIELTMVLIPPGKFMMGSAADEEGHRENESPQHLVTIAQPFFMGQHPITQQQWQAVAEMPMINRKLEPNPSNFEGKDDLPVENVSWQDAQEFCARLSIHSNRRYQLPSEAEWEYACRAGTTTPFHFGETIDAEIANYAAEDEKISETIYPGKYGRGSFGTYRQKTTSVGSFGVTNDFGLADMHGNVCEWCEDTWYSNYENAPNNGSAWDDFKENANNTYVLRGGSWINIPDLCRSAYRVRYDADSYYGNVGFRVVYAPARTL
jgi:formylglycine-generating enzyme required for sulfatase activity